MAKSDRLLDFLGPGHLSGAILDGQYTAALQTGLNPDTGI